jgi:hypothetical protein
MMGGKMPETFWAVNKRQDNKLKKCCIWLAIYLNCTMMHGLTNFKSLFIIYLLLEMLKKKTYVFGRRWCACALLNTETQRNSQSCCNRNWTSMCCAHIQYLLYSVCTRQVARKGKMAYGSTGPSKVLEINCCFIAVTIYIFALDKTCLAMHL